MGLQLKDSVIIVDEAHNLVGAVHDTHSATVTSQQLAVAMAQLSAYHLHFQSRLAPGKCTFTAFSFASARMNKRL